MFEIHIENRLSIQVLSNGKESREYWMTTYERKDFLLSRDVEPNYNLHQKSGLQFTKNFYIKSH